MFKIYKLSLSEPVDFAASELKKYLRTMMPDCGEIDIAYDPKATDGFRLGLLEEFGLPNEAEDPDLDDIVHIETTEEGGILAGSNPRSVLFAVYRFLKENGCRFLFPGTDGEYIPKKPVGATRYHKKADHRIRAHTTEGDPSLEQALAYIDYQTKNEMNAYGLSQIFIYHSRYYSHRFNEKNRPPEPVSRSLVDQWQALCEAELIKRGAILRLGGHGWSAQVAGLDPKDNHLYVQGKKEVPEHIRSKLAMMNGVRGLNKNNPHFTNLCWSQPELRSEYARFLARMAMENRQFAMLGISMADTSHNHCECEECQKLNPSDFLVMIANETDEILTKNGVKTKIFFSDYIDQAFPPVKARIKNPGRFAFQHAAITRSYTKSLTADSVIPEPKPYVRNKWEAPRTVEECMSYYRAWRKDFPCTGVSYEYHFWLHQFRDPGMLAISRRIYEDNMALKHYDISGCTEDGSNKSFFPNGFADHIFCASMWNRDLDYEAEMEDYFRHIYGEDWQQAKAYLEKISAAFDHAYMCGERSADPARGDMYNPAHAKDLEKVKEITAEARELIMTHLAMPTRPQTVCWRLLLRHTEWCDRLAEVFIEKCKGNNEESLALFERLIEDYGKYDVELERYFDFGLAVQSLQNVLKKRPQIEL